MEIFVTVKDGRHSVQIPKGVLAKPVPMVSDGGKTQQVCVVTETLAAINQKLQVVL